MSHSNIFKLLFFGDEWWAGIHVYLRLFPENAPTVDHYFIKNTEITNQDSLELPWSTFLNIDGSLMKSN